MAGEPQSTPERPPIKLEYVDLPELGETFADSIPAVHFDGQTLRITFGVTRYERPQQAQPTQPGTAFRYPACRLVLTSAAGVDLMNQMQKLKAGLIQAGVLKADA
jgi:hypothetical protein